MATGRETASRALRALGASLGARLAPPAGDWLRRACLEVAAVPEALAGLFPGAGRRVGRGALVDSAGPVRLFGDTGPLLNPWDVEDAARAVLLLGDAEREPEGAMERAVALYFQGGQRERIAVLRALQCLPESDAGIAALRDALRASAVDLFAAAICENLYASRRLPDDLFFQGALKAVFNGLRLDRIELIEKRASPELSRMLFAYVTEREKAGRPVAVELWPVMALHPVEGLRERIESCLAAAQGEYERQVLAVALERLRR